MNKVIIISAPSGSGKNTVTSELMKEIPNLSYSVSATTREKRINEIDGKDYYFISKTEFLEKIKNKEFVEYEKVYTDTYYGTLKTEIIKLFKEGKNIIFVTDVAGGINLKNYFGEDSISIFLNVSSKNLEERLKIRNADSEESIKERIEKAEHEFSFKDKFDFIIDNNDLSLSVSLCKMTINIFLEK